MNRRRDIESNNKVKNIILISLSVIIMAVLVIAIVLIYKKQNENQKIVIDKSTVEEENARIEAAVESAKKSIIINEIYFGEDEVWIELYNPSNYDIKLMNYSLSSNNDIVICNILEDVTIGAKGFITLSQEDYTSIGETDKELLFSGTGKLNLSTDNEVIIDTLYIPSMLVNEGYGRQEDGVMAFQYMTPTKNTSNASATIISKNYPVFSAPSGFYDDAFNLEIKISDGYNIYYTTDGSVPDEDSELYTGPITISDASGNTNIHSARTDTTIYTNTVPKNKVDKATIIRAIAVSDGGEASDVVSATYFVGFSNKSGYKDIPIISIMTDEENLFDYWDGIYVLGAVQDDILIRQSSDWQNANYWMNWEKDAYIHFFEGDKSLSYEGNIQLSVFNDILLNQPKKSLKLSAIPYSDTSRSTMHKYLPDTSELSGVILSAGRYDMTSMLRNSLVQEMMKDRAVITGEGCPCVVFLEGEYWGLYNMNYDYNEEYIASIYNIEPDNVIIAKNGQVVTGKEKDQLLYNEVIEFVLQNKLFDDGKGENNIDFSSNDAYCMLENMIDIQSLIDCYCSMIYTGNNEWLSGNVLMWRTRKVGNKHGEDGLWRWILYETDKSQSVDNRSTYRMNTFRLNALNEDPLFIALMQNEVFRQRFVTSFMDIVNNNYNIEGINEFLDEKASLYMVPTVASQNRFYGTGTTDSYKKNIESIKEFYTNRMEYIEKYITATFADIGDLKQVTVLSDSSKGEIKVNTSYIRLDDTNTWSGNYFDGYKIEIEAIPYPGYTFDHWEISDCESEDEMSQSNITINLNGSNPQVKVIYK